MALTPEMLEELTQGCKTPEELSKLYSQMLQHSGLGIHQELLIGMQVTSGDITQAFSALNGSPGKKAIGLSRE